MTQRTSPNRARLRLGQIGPLEIELADLVRDRRQQATLDHVP